MNAPLSDILWRWRGELDRGLFAIIGFSLFVLKHNIDRFVAIGIYDRPWSVFYYISPSDAARFGSMAREEVDFYATLVAIAIPFVYVGTLMTVKRLRSAGLPLWLVALFFAPFVNLVFFALLCLVPAADEESPRLTRLDRLSRFFDRIVPRGALGRQQLDHERR